MISIDPDRIGISGRVPIPPADEAAAATWSHHRRSRRRRWASREPAPSAAATICRSCGIVWPIKTDQKESIQTPRQHLQRVHCIDNPVHLFGQLFSDVATNEDGLQVDPEILDEEPALQDLVGVGQVGDPLLDLLAERGVVAVGQQRTQHHETILQHRYQFSSTVTAQQQLTAALERRERQLIGRPVIGHLTQFSLNVLFEFQSSQIKISMAKVPGSIPAATISFSLVFY